jgi:type II secretory pathway component PulC
VIVSVKKGSLMKHPFWLINSALLGVLCFAFLFIFFTTQKRPSRVSFEPDVEIKLPKKEISKIDLNKIYNNDLFNTYRLPTPEQKEEKLKPLPQPPKPKVIEKAVETPLKFLDPLGVELKGIMVAHDEDNNRAILKDKKTSTSKNYKLGDTIDDAQIIRILNKKIVLVRSNGQQETLYLTTRDAQIEQILSPTDNWQSVAVKKDATTYFVDPHNFAMRVRNLAQCIDMLNLTTVYRQGVSAGMRIGKVAENSLAPALGLQPGDVIETIQGISANDTKSRYEIYTRVIGLDIGQTVTLTMQRNNVPMTMTYILKELAELQPKKDFVATGTPATSGAQQELHTALIGRKTEEQIEEEKVRMLQEKKQFAPTIYELEKQEKQLMLNKGSRQERPESSRRGILSTTVEITEPHAVQPKE